MSAPNVQRYIAIDLGAESGRVMVAKIEDHQIQLEEVHRFDSALVDGADGLVWDFESILEETLAGLEKAAKGGDRFDSISVDSWGVDYVLFDANGEWLRPVYAYRNSRSDLGTQTALDRVPWERFFETTGIQYLPFNTAFQLASDPIERLERATRVLGVADAINHLLGGEPVYERSMASTTQLYNPVTADWAWDLIEELGFPKPLFPRIVDSGTQIGHIAPHLAKRAGLSADTRIVAGLSHDTGAAVAAAPATNQDWAYISSGTWSLIGVERANPILNETARTLNYTNEIGYNNQVRFLKNIIGLWLIQECRRDWTAQGQNYSYAEIVTEAEAAPTFGPLIDPADPRFIPPGGMVDRIQSFCAETQQRVPQSVGEVARCVFESLAALYAEALGGIETVTGTRPTTLHILGGGSQNRLLNQLTADAIRRPVIAGPQEATAIGAAIVQALSLGHFPSLQAARQAVANSYPVQGYTPQSGDAWNAALKRFRQLAKSR